MIYAFRCDSCGRSSDSTSREPHRCSCGGLLRRDYRSVQLRPTTAFQPHFNYSVGSYVNTELEFRDALKRTAEDNSIQTGTEHNYQPIDPTELARKKVTGDTTLIDQRPAKEEQWLRTSQTA